MMGLPGGQRGHRPGTQGSHCPRGKSITCQEDHKKGALQENCLTSSLAPTHMKAGSSTWKRSTPNWVQILTLPLTPGYTAS